MNIRVLIADDHKIVRESLRALLEKEPGFTVVGEAGEGRTAMRLTRELVPDVIIMDVAMPDLNGIEATRQVVAEFPEIKIIALSMHNDRRFVLNMLKAGARGYLLKDCASQNLIKAIRLVIANKTYISHEIADLVVKDYLASTSPAEGSPAELLTAREREILQLIVEGKTNQKIAEALKVSIKTVESHRHAIMLKLDIKSIAELTKFAIREGLTSP
jgi:two-component system, NarL family, response regulator NreC